MTVRKGGHNWCAGDGKRSCQDVRSKSNESDEVEDENESKARDSRETVYIYVTPP